MTAILSFCMPESEDCSLINTSAESDMFLDKYNLLNNSRYLLYSVKVPATTHEIVFNFGSIGKTASYIAIARADLLSDNNVSSLEILHSDDDSNYTSALNIDLTDATFIGVRGEDVLGTFEEIESKRFWKVKYTASQPSKFIHSKVYFGTMLDFGECSLDSIVPQEDRTNSVFISDDETKHFTRIATPRRNYAIQFTNVENSKIEKFIELGGKKINKESKGLCVFIATNHNHHLLEDIELLHAHVVQFSYNQTTSDLSDVTIEVQELLG